MIPRGFHSDRIMPDPAPVMVHQGLYGSLFQFDSEEHNWTEYVAIYEHYFSANKITDDKAKVSILYANVVQLNTYLSYHQEPLSSG